MSVADLIRPSCFPVFHFSFRDAFDEDPEVQDNCSFAQKKADEEKLAESVNDVDMI